MDVKERRKKVEELLRKKLGICDIAKLLGYATRVIERDVIWIGEHGESRQPDISISVGNEIVLGRKKEEKPSEVKVNRSKQIAKRREEIARLYNEGKETNEIAEELGISKQIVYQDIRILIEEKRIVKRERKRGTKSKNTEKSKQIAKRREEIARLYNEGKTVKEISEELGVTIATVYNDIKVLVEEKRIVKNTKRRTQDEKPEETKGRKKEIQKRVAKRREEIARLYNEGKTVKEISEELGVTMATVYNAIKVLEAEEKIERHKVRRKKNTAKVAKRREEIARLYNKGKEANEIAEELGISKQIVYQDIRILIEEKRIVKRERGTRSKSTKRREEVARLYNEGKEADEIAEELGISIQIVYRDIRILIEEKRIVKRERKSYRRSKPNNKKLEKIEELFSKGKSYGEIADELNLSIIDVMSYLQQVKYIQEGTKINEDRKINVKILYEQGKTIGDIAKELNITEALVREDLLSFGIIPDLRIISPTQKEKPEKQEKKDLEEKTTNGRNLPNKEEQRTPENHLWGIKERREEIAKLYDDGIENDEIARRLDIPLRVVERDIAAILDSRRFRDESSLTKMRESITSIESDENQETITKRRNRVEELVKQGENAEEIAEELGVEKSVIIQDMKCLMKEGRIPKSYKREFRKDRIERQRQKRNIIERREKVAELYKEGKTANEIAEEIGVPTSTIQNDIKLLLNEHIIEKREPKRRKGKGQIPKQGEETDLTSLGDRNTPEEKSVRSKSEQRYYNNILKVIKMCIQSGDFKGAEESIEMLKKEVKLGEEEKDKLDKLLTAIVSKAYSNKVARENEKDR